MKGRPSASITRLVTRPERLKREEGVKLRQLVMDLPAVTPDAERVVSRMVRLIDSLTPSQERWLFVQISPDQFNAVFDWLDRHSCRRLVALRVWAKLFRYLRFDDGEILATRAELAEAAGCSRQHLANVLAELVKINAIIRRRDGHEVRLFINPNIGTQLSGSDRDRAQAEAPRLHLVPAI